MTCGGFFLSRGGLDLFWHWALGRKRKLSHASNGDLCAGFIGSHVAEHCLKLGMDVVATDDLSAAYRECSEQSQFVKAI